jgi:tetratricopeptide (TPR) repeat protein
MALVGLAPSLPLWAGDQPADEPIKEERDQLQRRAEDLVKQAKQLSEHGKYADATKLQKQIIAIYQINLGALLQEERDYARARACFQHALAIRQLLTQFFENLWHRGMERLEALRQARLAVRRGEGNRTQPRYWAAWVLSGDPRKLDFSPNTVRAELPEAVAAAPSWSGWPWYAAGAGALGVLVVGLVAVRHRRAAR